MAVSTLEYSLMAGYSYYGTRDRFNRIPFPSGWLPFDEPQGLNRRVGTDGFEAAAFQRGNEIVISFAGTYPKPLSSSNPDIQADIALGAGAWHSQLLQAAQYFLDIKKANPDATITFTGHSLGGGLAALMAVFFNLPAYTFDQAPFFLAASVNNANTLYQDLAADLIATGLAETLQAAGVPYLFEINKRMSNVHDVMVAGEFLSVDWPYRDLSRLGSEYVLNHGSNGVDSEDLHSQDLLIALRYSEKFKLSTYQLPYLVKDIFDRNMFRRETDSSSPDFLANLIRYEFGIPGTPNSDLDLLTKFGSDTAKLGAFSSADQLYGWGGSNPVDQLLLHILMNYYYLKETPATEVVEEFFTQLSGGLQFDLGQSLGGTDLAGIRGYSDLKTWIKWWLSDDIANQIENFLADPKRLTLGLAERISAASAGDDAGDFMLSGSAGGLLRAGDGDDLLVGRGGFDTLIGDGGDDTLIGSKGSDNLQGGAGDDLYIYSSGDGGDFITDSEGSNIIKINGNTFSGTFRQITKGSNFYSQFDAEGNAYGPQIVRQLNAAGDYTLTIDLKDGINGDTLRLANWTQANDFGISLIDAVEEALPALNDPLVIGTGLDPNSPNYRLIIEDQRSNSRSLVYDAALYYPDPVNNSNSEPEQPYSFEFIGGMNADRLQGGVWIRDGVWQAGPYEFPDELGMVTDVLYGWDGNDVIYGDRIEGVDSNAPDDGDADWLIGGRGSDTLFGGTGTDLLLGRQERHWGLPSGSNPLTENEGDSDYLNGGAGMDRVYGGSYRDTLIGGAGTDRLVAAAGDDLVSGGDDDDHIYGDSFIAYDRVQEDADVAAAAELGFSITALVDVPDFINSSNPNYQASLTYDDTLEGGSGNDWIYGEIGKDVISGDDGDDTIAGDRLNHKDFIDGYQQFYHPLDSALQDADTIYGGLGKDYLYGNGGGDYLDGGEGNDFIFGDDPVVEGFDPTNFGSDTVFAGEGNDLVDGGGGDDQLFGDAGDDTMWGDDSAGQMTFDFLPAASWDADQDGRDYLDGGEGNDLLYGGGNSDVLFGGVGNDQLRGDDSEANLDGSFHGDDTLIGGEGNDNVWGDGGNDTLTGDAGDDFLYGDAAESELDITFHGSDTLAGGDGDDYVNGNGGNDTITGDDGRDLLWGGSGNDVISGGSGNDQLSGDDIEAASLGDDILMGGDGDDALWGNGGNDTLIGGIGLDYLAGGAGNDVYVLAAGDSPYLGSESLIENIDDEGGSDTLRFDGVTLSDISLLSWGASLQITYGTTDSVWISNGAIEWFEVGSTRYSKSDLYRRTMDSPVISSSNQPGASLIGGAQNDQLTAQGGSSTLAGGWGDDTLVGGGGDLFLFDAGDGMDSITDVGGNAVAPNIVRFGEGITASSLSLSIQNGSLLVRINDGTNDGLLLQPFSSSNPLGSVSIDRFEFADGTALTYSQLLQIGFDFTGTSSDDVITGTTVADRIVGNLGDDTLIGGLGDDTYTFNYGDGADQITDGGGVDVLRFGSGISATDLSLISYGIDLVLQLSNGTDSIVIRDWFTSSANQIEQIQFADGTVWMSSYVNNNVVFRSTVLYGTDDHDFLRAPSSIPTTIYGYGGSDNLYGGASDDVIVGGTGNDGLEGGGGSDVYKYSLGDGLDGVYDAGGSADVIQLDSGIDPGQWIASRTGDDLKIFDPNGSGQIGIIRYFSSPSNIVEEIRFANGMIWSPSTIASMVAIPTGGNDVLKGSLDNDTLAAQGGLDTLYGFFGSDSLDGGTGADSLIGGAGDDFYFVDDVGDVVVEDPGAGVDAVTASITYVLGANIENLVLAGAAAINGTGNSGDNNLTGNSAINILTGGSGNDIFNGGGGKDTFIGGAGNDTYYLFNGELVSELSNEGVDSVLIYDYSGTISSFMIGTNIENLSVYFSASNFAATGNASNNIIDARNARYKPNSGQIVNVTLDGGAGNDTLYGGKGMDSLTGGLGDDTLVGDTGNDFYYVDSMADVIIESVGSDWDRVYATANYVLSENLEELTLSGTATYGCGNSSANQIWGNASANTLSGGYGDDTLLGGDGNDTYVFDVDVDLIYEYATAKSGVDEVQSAFDFTLTDNLENLTLLGGSNINGSGNSLANVLRGNTGNNKLDGGAGADTMIGGVGNDTYFVDSTKDVVTENANEGIDEVRCAITYALGANVEDLLLIGAASIGGTGNTLNNKLTGNSGANTLSGGAGNDVIDGLAGADKLVGGIGDDIYIMGRGSAADVVVDTDSTLGNTDVLSFLSGVAADQLWFRHVGKNLEVSIIGTSDSATISNWYSGSSNHVEQFKTADGKLLLDTQVENLVSAMAAFAPPSAGQTTLPQNYQDSLNSVIAANWH